MKPYYEHAGITIYHGDCREILPGLKADVIVTDPPYGTGGRRRGLSGAGSNPTSSVVREPWDVGDTEWLTGEPGLAAVFWPDSRALRLLSAASSVGLLNHRLVYYRKSDPMPQPSRIAPFGTEPIWLLSRDGIPFRSPRDSMEGTTPRLGRDSEATGHPYEKPRAVMEWLVGSLPGDTVLDPFMGSGTTLVAAKNLGRRAIGIEIEERYCEIAARRLAQEILL